MPGVARPDQSKIVGSEGSHAIENVVACPPITKIRIGCHTAAPGGGNHRLDSHQTVGGWKGQGLEHARVYHTEDRCGRANPERQDGDGNRGKAWVLPEPPQAIAHVRDDFLWPAESPPLLARLSFVFCVAQPPP